MKSILGCYFSDWQVPLLVSIGLFMMWFGESYLAIGPGWDKWWIYAWVVNLLVFIMMFLFKRGKRIGVAVALAVSTSVLIGGCYYFKQLASVPEQIMMTEYNRFFLGQYSEFVPTGASNIEFRHYDGFIFAGAEVKCNVSKKDFLWFCWRNKYPIRKGAELINENTGKAPRTTWFGLEPQKLSEDHYTYFNFDEEGCAGYKLLYDIKDETMYMSWSTN